MLSSGFNRTVSASLLLSFLKLFSLASKVFIPLTRKTHLLLFLLYVPQGFFPLKNQGSFSLAHHMHLLLFLYQLFLLSLDLSQHLLRQLGHPYWICFHFVGVALEVAH